MLLLLHLLLHRLHHHVLLFKLLHLLHHQALLLLQLLRILLSQAHATAQTLTQSKKIHGACWGGVLGGIPSSMSPVHLLTEGWIVSQELFMSVDRHFLLVRRFRGGKGEVFEAPAVEFTGKTSILGLLEIPGQYLIDQRLGIHNTKCASIGHPANRILALLNGKNMHQLLRKCLLVLVLLLFGGDKQRSHRIVIIPIIHHSVGISKCITHVQRIAIIPSAVHHGSGRERLAH
mmetsp:Transcript_21409/g.36778  ORF Transcript_21409/g.36778 Transcript_21409/m.36778 type:complete len:232 (-) Transcript_21409:751-1446(-)